MDVVRAAADMGVRLHPWQVHAAMVAGEQIPDPDTGQLVHAYSTVVLAVPRRAGKSLLMLCRMVAGLRSQPEWHGWYSAQARSDAALVLKDEWLPKLHGARSRIGHMVDVRLANGSEAIMWPSLDSTARLFAPTREGLHGTSGDFIAFDEAWSHTLERGRELQLAARPLMATRPGAQQWIVSAAGDTESTWWIDWLDAGRTAVAADMGRGICHLEWSADHPDLDPDDEDTWLIAHPAVRTHDHPHGTITMDWLRDEHATDPAMFRRMYLNITDRATSAVSPIDMDTWDRLAVQPPARRGLLSIGVDCAPDQSHTAIVVCHGGTTVEVVDHAAGWSWATQRIVDLYDRYNVAAVALDAAAPAGALLQPLQTAGMPVVDCQLRTVTAAAAQLVEAVRTGDIHHVPHPALDAAVTHARRRPIQDGAWTWGRKSSDVDVSPLVAAGLARITHPAHAGTVPTVM